MRTLRIIVVSCCAFLALTGVAAARATGGISAPAQGSGTTVTSGSSATVASGGVAPSAPSPTARPTPLPVRAGHGSSDVPRTYLHYYRLAGRAEGVNWKLLAAIGKMESDHGRSAARGVAAGLNFAHCCAGPMQICIVKSCGDPWAHYAVDGDGDGRMSVYDPGDAIYASARMVHDLEAIVGRRSSWILAAYNAGPGRVLHYRGVPPFSETRSYVSRGLAYMRSLRR